MTGGIAATIWAIRPDCLSGLTTASSSPHRERKDRGQRPYGNPRWPTSPERTMIT
jgi:hypothetical protein